MIMKDTMGIILTGTEKIPPITDHRSVAALPFAGRYRIIDFVLSNMASAGITNIGVATKNTYSSLMDHIKSGKPWDLDRKYQGLSVLPPNLWENSHRSLRGNIDILAGIRGFLKKSHQTYVILSLDTHIYNLDFKALVKAHIANQADITVVYHNMKGAPESELSRFNLLDIDDQNQVIDIESHPYYPKTTNAAMDIYVMEKALLESIIDECLARGDHDFVTDALSKKLSGMRIFGHEYTGYTDRIDSLKSYYINNMAFLQDEVRKEMLNNSRRPIYTKNKDLPPARYGDSAVVENSLISDGCIIEGTVQNCILSRGVKIAKGAVVKNSIIMQDSVIDSDVSLDYVVFDKEVHITKGRCLLGQDSYPLAIAKHTVI
ncbi:MAG: glucose-1-phosphate adenylyltransferase subunit GlgD [Ruminococcaceae bacterium]|nr:glucose-1-phosphate adenylyltransferase subunit GlgD [Oscillospiraceae bacterium]